MKRFSLWIWYYVEKLSDALWAKVEWNTFTSPISGDEIWIPSSRRAAAWQWAALKVSALAHRLFVYGYYGTDEELIDAEDIPEEHRTPRQAAYLCWLSLSAQDVLLLEGGRK